MAEKIKDLLSQIGSSMFSSMFPMKFEKTGEAVWGINSVIVYGILEGGADGGVGFNCFSKRSYSGEVLVFFSDDIGNYWYLPKDVFMNRFGDFEYVQED